MPYWPPLFPAVVTDMGGQFFNIRAYGAVCDGITDDLAAWNAAIAAVGTAGRGTVYCPAPSAVSDTVVINVPNCNIQFGYANYTRTPQDNVLGVYLCPTSTFPATGVPLMSYGVSGAGVTVPNNPHGGIIFGAGFQGNDNAGTGIAGVIGLQVNDTSDVWVQGCTVANCAGTGFQFNSTVSATGMLSPRILASNFAYNGTHLYVNGTGATDGYVASCIFRLATTTGVSLGATAAAGGGYLFENCHFTSANTTQVNHILGTSSTGMVNFVNCYFDTISGGSHIQGLTKAQITGCFFELSSSSGATQAAPVQMGGTNPRLTFTGNYLECNGNTYVKAFVQFYNIGGSGAVAAFPDNAAFGANIVRNNTGQPPASYLGIAIDGANIPLGNTAPAAQPLVSGTVYQNTYGQAMWVNQVVTMTTTASTASAATISVGPHGGTLVEADSFTLPSTAPQGIEYVLQARVPASWDYRLVLSNATAGTTTMTAEM